MWEREVWTWKNSGMKGNRRCESDMSVDSVSESEADLHDEGPDMDRCATFLVIYSWSRLTPRIA